ncbi:MAG: tRNA isopentenyl-2-thiomethyl-A-37 hydroxylase MiaE [Planctomycetota bacterium]
MLTLRSQTPIEWAERVGREPFSLLSDHAHCELRAANSAQALIHHHTAHGSLCDRLAALAVEEMTHFRQVLGLLEELGGSLQPGPKSPYADGLLGGARGVRGARDEALLDRLLIAGLIEARSLERFELLAEHAPEPRMRALYAELGPSERGHAELFPKLALRAFDPEHVAERARVLEALEAEVLDGLDQAPRMHSGH